MIDLVALAKQLLQTATVAVQIKQRMEVPTKRIEVTKELSIKLQEETEEELTEALIPFFEKQVESMASRLSGMGSIGDDPEKVAKQIFTPSAWDDELVNITLPILAVKSVEAAVTYFQTMGLDVTGGKLQERALKRRRMRSKSRLGTCRTNHPYRFRRPQTKATTATEWLESHSDDWDELVGAVEAAGLPTQLMTEIPPWMQASIAENLTESFEQDYWQTINETSGGHAEAVLREGLGSGWSIRRMADSMRAESEGYSRFRATNIARTESGGALNAARKGSVDALQEEIPEVLMPQFWLSVCGNTTRPEHCANNNVQENEEKLWNLAGYLIPWPGHFSLPPSQRCNCQCTIYAELGIGTEQSQGAIDGIGAEVGVAREGMEGIGEDLQYTTRSTMKEARTWAERHGAPISPTNAKDAANQIGRAYAEWRAEMMSTNPERWGDLLREHTVEGAKANWLEVFRSRKMYKGNRAAFVGLDKNRALAIQNAINDNHANPLYRRIKEKNYQERVLFHRAAIGEGANAEYRVVTHYLDQWPYDDVTSKVGGIVPGKPTVPGGVANVLRHEYGHGLFDRLSDSRKARIGDLFVKYQSRCESDLSMYAGSRREEFFAETFSLATDRNYKPEKFQPWVRDLTSEILSWVL